MYLSTRETVVGPFKIYKDVDGKFKNFTDGCRVLPSTYFENEYTTVFTLKRKYEPGENKTFKNGGFEVYGPSGEIRNFDLDQVIVHPFELKILNEERLSLRVSCEDTLYILVIKCPLAFWKEAFYAEDLRV